MGSQSSFQRHHADTLRCWGNGFCSSSLTSLKEPLPTDTAHAKRPKNPSTNHWAYTCKLRNQANFPNERSCEHGNECIPVVEKRLFFGIRPLYASSQLDLQGKWKWIETCIWNAGARVWRQQELRWHTTLKDNIDPCMVSAWSLPLQYVSHTHTTPSGKLFSPKEMFSIQ